MEGLGGGRGWVLRGGWVGWEAGGGGGFEGRGGGSCFCMRLSSSQSWLKAFHLTSAAGNRKGRAVFLTEMHQLQLPEPPLQCIPPIPSVDSSLL